jgi:hypothetical protein
MPPGKAGGHLTYLELEPLENVAPMADLTRSVLCPSTGIVEQASAIFF